MSEINYAVELALKRKEKENAYKKVKEKYDNLIKWGLVEKEERDQPFEGAICQENGKYLKITAMTVSDEDYEKLLKAYSKESSNKEIISSTFFGSVYNVIGIIELCVALIAGIVLFCLKEVLFGFVVWFAGFFSGIGFFTIAKILNLLKEIAVKLEK